MKEPISSQYGSLNSDQKEREEVDASSDIMDLGVAAYHMMVGHDPTEEN